MLRRLGRLTLAGALALTVGGLTAPAARAAVSVHASRMKEMQVRLLQKEMRERQAERRERAELLR